MDSLYERSAFHKAFEKHKVLIAAHRGTPTGNITENTVSAFTTAFASGADIAETDLIRSRDGVLYCFHDGSEPVNFQKQIDIRELNSSEIDELMMLNRIGLPSGRHLDRFETVMQTFTHGELFNIDRSWNIYPEVIEFLRAYPKANETLLFKGPARAEYLEIFASCGQDYLFMPIVYSLADIELALSYPTLHIAGFELIANSPDHELFGAEICRKLHERGSFAWVNTLDLGILPEHVLYGGLNDSTAILQGHDYGWGRIASYGVDVLQTDFPALVYNWRAKAEAEAK